jgi:hypothetical protein
LEHSLWDVVYNGNLVVEEVAHGYDLTEENCRHEYGHRLNELIYEQVKNVYNKDEYVPRKMITCVNFLPKISPNSTSKKAA